VTSLLAKIRREPLLWLKLLAILPLPWIVTGVLSVRQSSGDMRQWLPDGQEAGRNYEAFRRQFGADDFLILSWPNCPPDDDRLERVAAALENRSGVSGDALIRRILTPAREIDRLTESPLRLSRETAIENLEGLLVGRDHTAACMIVELSSHAREDPERTLADIRSTAEEFGPIEPDKLLIAGSVYEAAFIVSESRRSMRENTGLSVLAGLIVTLCCLRRLHLTAVVVVSAVYATLLALAAVHLTGGRFNSVMIVMPTLIFVLTISGAIHLSGYYDYASTKTCRRHPALTALSLGWLPCMLAALTTAVGMLSLSVSGIRPVREFGVYSALGLVGLVFTLLVVTPALLGLRRGPQRACAHTGMTKAMRAPVLIASVGRTVIRHHLKVTLLSIMLLATAAVGLVSTTTSIRLARMFLDSSELLSNYRTLEDCIGPLSSAEVLVTIPVQSRLSFVRRLTLVSEVGDAVRHVNGGGAVISAATMASPLDGNSFADSLVRRAVLQRNNRRIREQWIRDRMLVQTETDEIWRVSIRVPALAQTDYRTLVDDLERSVGPVLSRYQTNVEESPTATITGAFPLIQDAQNRLLGDLVNSFVIAFVVICPVMMLVLRDVVAGLLAMLPNITPAVVVFGTMGWLGKPVDIGMILTASIALGIAVDGTLHVLVWFRRGIRQGMPPIDAVSEAYRRCARPLIHTTLICGAGLLVFVRSEFVPTSRFAVMIVVLLVMALVGDLVLLPALLVGPAGRLFRPRGSSTTRRVPDRLARQTAEMAKSPPPSATISSRTG